jgi:hypothetical protein
MTFRPRLDSLARREAGAWLLAALFVACAAPLLPTLQYNFDEGVYLQQGLLILGGKLPYRDFFCHQTPLYPLTVAAVAAAIPRSLFVYRLSSLLATALAGLFVYRIATHLLPRKAALTAQLLFYVAPIQFYGLLALPQAIMQLCTIAGIYLVFFRRRRTAVVAGAVLLAVSILYKPLSLPPCIAAGMALLAIPHQRWKLLWVVPTGVLVGALAWGVFQVISADTFSQLLQLQSSRMAQKGGFETFMEYEVFRQVAQSDGVRSALGWNLNEHKRAFLFAGVLNGNLWLLVLAAAGQALVWLSGGRWRNQRLLLTLWWACTLVFSLFVWEPIWDHYCLVYLPPLVILAALCLDWLWRTARWRVPARAAAVLGLLGVTFLGVASVALRRTSYGAETTASNREAWLTFDPFINFVTETEPACGIIDPFNVYGRLSLAARASTPELSRYYIGPDQVIRCLEAHPDAKIAFGFWAHFFVDPQLRDYLQRLPPERWRAAPPAAWPPGAPGPSPDKGPISAKVEGTVPDSSP